MSWRLSGGTNPNPHGSQPPEDDYPPLPAPRLPPLRTLNSPRHRDTAPRPPTATANNRPQSRFWAAASRRAERIRGLDRPSTSSGILDSLTRPMEHNAAWLLSTSTSTPASASASSRRSARLRGTETRPSNFEDLDRSLDEANSHLRALLDLTSHANLSTTLMPPSFSPPLRATDFSDDNRRSKRRKLDAERLAPNPKPFRYGKYGQVEPGQLRMEMVSCDGGLFSNESSYAAENILKDDNSVYCTKGNRCNVVLRHQGGSIFSLQELVIKAPGSMNYSHPVREGMVFVAMDQDDTLNRTAQFQIQYADPPKDRPWHAPGADDWHFFDRDPRRVISVRHHDDGTTSTRARRSYTYRADDDENRRLPQMPNEFASNIPDVRITTECSGDEDDLTRRPPNRIGALPFESMDSESDSDAEPTNPFGAEDFATMGETYSRAHSRADNHTTQTHSRANVSLAEAWDAHANATQEAVRAVGGGLLSPHARFYIEKRKNRCTIRFDPPVSGRFILLKMWSSQQDPSSNIDVQSVIAHGFAGPRYFPSVNLA